MTDVARRPRKVLSGFCPARRVSSCIQPIPSTYSVAGLSHC